MAAYNELDGLSGYLPHGGSNFPTTGFPVGATKYTLVFPGTPGTAGYVLSTNGAGVTSWVAPGGGGGGGGSVTAVSVVSANGFAGTVATSTSTPAITISTSITGLLKGNGTAISAAVAGTDFLTPTGSAAGLTSCPTLNQNTTGSAASLTTARNINGVSFNGTADITVTAAAGTLTGTTLNSSVVSSSLTSVGTLSSGSIPASLITAGTFGTGGYTMATSLTTPLLVGGTGTGSTLTLQTTSGAGAVGIAMLFKGGNNGATTLATVTNAGAWDFQSGSITTTANIIANAAVFAGAARVGASSQFYWNGRAQMFSPADGIIQLMNAANTDFTRLQFGGTTSSFPSIKRNAAALNFRLADDSGDAAISTAGITASGLIDCSSQVRGTSFRITLGNSYTWNGGTAIKTGVDGDLVFTNAAGSSFTQVQFGGITSSFPALRVNSTSIDVKLADNSAFTTIQSLYQRFGSGSPEGVVTAPVGAYYSRTDGGANTSLYVKESGAGNTGWVAK